MDSSSDAVSSAEAALHDRPIGSPDRAWALYELAKAHQARYSAQGSRGDLELARNLYIEAIEHESDSVKKARYLNNLGTVYQLRYDFEGNEVDLDAFVEYTRQATIHIASELRPAVLKNYANALQARYNHRGDPSDLDSCIEINQDALNLSSASRPALCCNLCGALTTRYAVSHAQSDLDKALEVGSEAVFSTDNEYPLRALFLDNYANALYEKYGSTNSASDLESSIEYGWEAMEMAQEQGLPGLSGMSANLAGSLASRFKIYRRKSDLDDAVDLFTLAADTIDPQHPSFEKCLASKGNALRMRFEELGLESDLKLAVDVCTRAVNLRLSEDFSIRGMCLNNLGKAYELRHEKKEQHYDFNKARTYYEMALELESAPPMLRVMAGYRGMLLTWSENPSLGVTFLRKATKLLPLISPRLLSRLDQQDNIATFSGLGSIGASIILESGGECQEALQTLEMSRGVMNSLLLETRLDTTDLDKYDSTLTKEFITLRDQLDGSSNAFASASDLPIGPTLDMERRIKTSKRITDILEQIYSDQKMKEVFLNPSIKDLSLLDNEMVVTINVSSVRSDALIVKRNRTWQLQLKDLHQEDVLHHAREFLETLEIDSPVSRRKTNKRLHGPPKRLWEKIISPVLLELGIGGNTDEWPHVWWIPVGLVSIFPLHAAGDHSGKTNDNALDRVISSYATTIRSLSYSWRVTQRALAATSTKAVFVAMASTPNQTDLRFANEEVSQLLDKIPQGVVTRVVLKSPVYKGDILSALQHCNIAHFSCHGIVDPLNPSNSSLLLSDWETNPLTVADITALKVTSARLAYLSACHASSNRELDLLDEGIHLTGAFQMAGFPQTIGTLWQVDDERSGVVSQVVWDTMLNPDGTVHFDKAAEGLHHAVRALRDQTRRIEGMEKKFPDQPMVWAPFIHMGI
ncbi:CHAT domain-containing protein [Leptodontidium sp. MPI-SDFR-AT-0119]|nr:CHAT domain-containing protein [Leptodontidium sp. MPI-SDFR-AT-0119]